MLVKESQDLRKKKAFRLAIQPYCSSFTVWNHASTKRLHCQWIPPTPKNISGSLHSMIWSLREETSNAWTDQRRSYQKDLRVAALMLEEITFSVIPFRLWPKTLLPGIQLGLLCSIDTDWIGYVPRANQLLAIAIPIALPGQIRHTATCTTL
ncbi:unnamed protein product [Prunus armeniaca]|uniref:Uncharacterized protein n=1 Tax=Prunus armeniaca TaxID=36596 RepID=A0A6J5WNY6_PRUAR|nr:unnamed protein product [Prunus armeniaca]